MPMFRCPICNSPLSVWGVSATGPAEKFRELADRAKTPWRDSTVQPMPTPVQFPIPRPPQSISHSWDVRTAVQAGFASGFMSALLSMPLAIAGSVTFPYISTIEIPWFFPAAVFCIATPLTFFAVSLHPASALNMLKEKIEPFIGIDLNGDNQIGTPAPERLEVEVTQTNERGQITGIKLLDMLNIPAELLREFAAAAVAGDSLTVARWTGASGKFSQPQYQAMMAELERAGLVEPGRGNQGRSLTHAGRAVLRRIAG